LPSSSDYLFMDDETARFVPTPRQGVVLDSDRLRHEMARRGWSQTDLAMAAALSPPTITAALAGRGIAPKSLRRIATALATTVPIDGIESLLPRADLFTGAS
jgi:transcriptional regulator with XRE-family HTH domain